MGDVRRGVEKLIDAMTTVGLDDTAVSTLGVLLDHVSRISEQHAGFDDLNGLEEAFTRCFNDSHRLGVGSCLVAHIICLIQVAMEAFVVQGDVEIEDIAIQEDSLIRYAVAYHLIG